MKLPDFKYHPDPVRTHSIVAYTGACSCCGEERGFSCSAGIYSEHDVASICPWCVSDGSAAERFSGEFNDVHWLQGYVPESVIDDVARKTPGFTAFQQPFWVGHCHDACVFMGEVTASELKGVAGESLSTLLEDNGLDHEMWEIVKLNYDASSTTVFRFDCAHCAQRLYTIDFA
ncbi:MAG: hypothetical protein GY774_28115 [Planctomycetes bacterium]|nr:hypothetical protein [Planctomycetota bacterium]